MANLLLQSSVLLSKFSSSPPPSSSSSSSSFSSLPCINIPTKSTVQRLNNSKRSVVLRAASIEKALNDLPGDVDKVIDGVEKALTPTSEIKVKLLSIVAGLNKGLAVNVEDMEKADAAAKELEAAGGTVDISEDQEKLQGRWKLVYSSGFSSRTLGGSHPGPPIGRLLPITLGQVFQRIDIFSKDFDNIVELQLGAPWPLPPIEATATLEHKYELTGSAKVKIIFEKTMVKTSGNLSQLPLLELPRIPDAFRPSSRTGSGEFEITYLDADTRITRGDRGELRVFVKA
ncbi:hypothetical protein MKX01_039331 [Papaver californicum]|nr:hypothetical protein MKX01_039331 [Papaver californicum]